MAQARPKVRWKCKKAYDIQDSAAESSNGNRAIPQIQQTYDDIGLVSARKLCNDFGSLQARPSVRGGRKADSGKTRARAKEGRMNGKRRWTKETQVRFLLVTGILLSLVAYLLFVSVDGRLGPVLATLTAVSSLAISFYGLWSWNAYQKAQWSGAETRPNAG